MGKYTLLPANLARSLQMNAGIATDFFNPATGQIGNILGATNGGYTFNATPQIKDLSESLDNAPSNTKQLKLIEYYDVHSTGNFASLSEETVERVNAACDIETVDGVVHVVPRTEILDSDYKDIWWIGDFSDVNTGADAGFLAIHLMNVLNVGGFSIQSNNRDLGNFSFDFQAHYDLADISKVPYEIYMKGGASTAPRILLSKQTIMVPATETYTLNAEVIPAGQTVTWTSANTTVASVTAGVVTAGESAGNTIITASITVDGVSYSDTCTVIVTED